VIKRVLFAVVAVSALATAVGTAVVASAFAVYALLVPQVGEAGAAAAVAAIAAIVVGVAGLFAALHAKGGRRRPEPEPSLTERLMQAARERPLLAAGGALAAGLIALKNPQAAMTLVSAFVAGKATERTDRRR
jgi:hypothetical protein